MIRRIIQIDEEKCNGCGACATACHEGAIGMVDGKAKLLRDDKVEYENNQYSLSGLADKLLRELGYDWKSVQGSNFFEYNGKTLYQIKKDLEDEETEDSEEDTF